MYSMNEFIVDSFKEEARKIWLLSIAGELLGFLTQTIMSSKPLKTLVILSILSFCTGSRWSPWSKWISG